MARVEPVSANRAVQPARAPLPADASRRALAISRSGDAVRRERTQRALDAERQQTGARKSGLDVLA